jgi:hypothetical protein
MNLQRSTLGCARQNVCSSSHPLLGVEFQENYNANKFQYSSPVSNSIMILSSVLELFLCVQSDVELFLCVQSDEQTCKTSIDVCLLQLFVANMPKN